MTRADSQEKKRKRDSEGPTTSNKLHNMASKITPNNVHDPRDSKDIFDDALSIKEDHLAYLKGRLELLQGEDDIAWDRAVKKKSSQVEKKAGKIVIAIREYERKVTFGNIASEAIPGPETRDMGGQFLTNKSRIETRSLLYKISKLVPKGALLHLHFNAELHPERLLEEARDMKATMFIRSIRPLRTQEDLDLTEMVFNVMPEDTLSVDIFSKDYQGTATNFKGANACKEIWMRWQEFRVKFNASEFAEKVKQPKEDLLNENGRKPNSSEQGHVKLDPAENWLKQKMVLSEQEAYDPAQTVNG
jgi:adenosine deaminase CECR1